jgi:hypothetical protein
MKGLFFTLLIVAPLILFPAVAFGQMNEPTGGQPPISQPLVREGTFAYDLAVALDLGSVTDEAAAESMLSSAGIAPKNGWIADYPVTPEIVVELQDSVESAADSGELTMSKDDAMSAVQDLADRYGLSVTEGEEGGPNGVNSPPSYYDNSGLDNYYYDEGPPVVTYYAPPPAYAYLYSWVPYPFWWSDFWFPGFFILGDFDRTIIVRGHHEHFSNHFFDHNRGRFSRVVPRHSLGHGSFAGSRNGFRGGKMGGRHNATRGMRDITRWRNSHGEGNRTTTVSPGAGTRMRRPHVGNRFAPPTGGRMMTGQPSTNSAGRFRPDRNFERQNRPMTVAPHSQTTIHESPRRSYEGNRTFEGRPDFGTVPHGVGGHSSGGFRGSTGGRFRR